MVNADLSKNNLRIVCGGKHPSGRWVVVNQEDTQVLFDPMGEIEISRNLKICQLWVNHPEYREALQKFAEPLDIDLSSFGY